MSLLAVYMYTENKIQSLICKFPSIMHKNESFKVFLVARKSICYSVIYLLLMSMLVVFMEKFGPKLCEKETE